MQESLFQEPKPALLKTAVSGSTLYHNDCLSEMEKLIDKGQKVDLIITDPPYKMTKRGKSCRPNYMQNNMGDNVFEGELPNTKEWMKKCYDLLNDNTHFYVFTNTVSLKEYLTVAEECGFKLHNVITMIKDTKMPNRWYLKYSELVLFFRKGNAKPINDMTSRDYLFVETPTLKTGKLHISQKPLNFIEKLITNSSNENEIVMDIFMGSGTTGVACRKLNRDFIGIEKEKEFFDISESRIAEYCH